jgi:hypothetical protein
MANSPAQTTVSLRGSLCRDLLEMVASGANATEAAKQLISELLNAPGRRYCIRQVGGVFVFERPGEADSSHTRSNLFQ